MGSSTCNTEKNITCTRAHVACRPEWWLQSVPLCTVRVSSLFLLPQCPLRTLQIKTLSCPSPVPSSQHERGTQSMLRQMAGDSVSGYSCFPLGGRQKSLSTSSLDKEMPRRRRQGHHGRGAELAEGETPGPSMPFPQSTKPRTHA